MNKSDVLAKTAKGAEEIRTRAHGLHQKLRALLIVIDGKQSVAALTERYGSLGDVEATLSELLAQAFIEVASSTAPAAEPQPPGQTAQEAVRELCHSLHDMLGPDADSLTGRLEQARDRSAFLAALQRAQDTVGAVAGAKKAESIGQHGLRVADRYFPQ